MINFDTFLKTPNPEQCYTAKEIKELRKRIGSLDDAQRTIQLAYTEIDRLCQALDLPPEICSESQSTYQAIIATELINNRSIAMLVSGIVYFHCLKYEVPRGLSHVAAASVVRNHKREADDSWGNPSWGGKSTLVGRSYREVAAHVGEVHTGLDPGTFIGWYCNLLGVNQQVELRAKEILEITEDDRETGGKPSVIAAAALYFASTHFDDIDLTQKDISEISLTHERTIRKRYRELMESFTERDDEYDISTQPYVGDAPWMNPRDREVLQAIRDSNWEGSKVKDQARWDLITLFEYELVDFEDDEPVVTVLGEKYLEGDLNPNELIKTRLMPPLPSFLNWLIENEPKSSWELRSKDLPRRLPRYLMNKGYLEGSFFGYRVSDEAKNILQRESQTDDF